MKNMNKIIWAILFAFIALVSCSDDNESVDPTKDLIINEFSINGVQGEINNEDMTVVVTLPANSDVTSLTPEIKVPAGATVKPITGVPINFTNPVKYTIENGNKYNIYTVTVYVVNAQITRFILDDKYQGIIDQESRKISVSVKPSTDVTNMTPSIKFTDGAQISPSATAPQDFTNPVKYTLTYMNTTFEYTVEVKKREEAFAFIGTAATVDELPSLHEKKAAEWMLSTIPKSHYISFDDVKSGKVELNSYDVVWFHYETWMDLPAIVLDASVINKFKEYYQGGGNILFTSYACLYVGHTGISKNGGPNNYFGDINAWTVPERWGISYQGDETHPIFKNLEQADDLLYPAAYFIGNNVHRRNAGCMWHIEPEPYNKDRNKWAELTGGKPLAALNWNQPRDIHVVVAEFPKVTNGNGAVICIGAPSYEWYNEDIAGTPSPANPYLGNIQTITKNAIEYLKD